MNILSTVKNFGIFTLLSISTNLLASTPTKSSEIAIFSYNENLNELSANKAKKLYRGKTKRLDGIRVELSDWPENSEVRTSFYHGLLKKNSAQMNAYWAGLSFSGKARPPSVINNADIQTLINWLKENEKRVGYAPITHVPNDANIIYTVAPEK